jgi:hypothetical protein
MYINIFVVAADVVLVENPAGRGQLEAEAKVEGKTLKN